MIAAGIVLSLLSSSLYAQQKDSPGVERFKKDIQPLLSKYCYECHGDGGNKGKVSFDELKTETEILDHDLWLRAIRNVRAGLMPPLGHDRPTDAEMKVLETWIKRDAFSIDPTNLDPGRVTLRRLNRTEYHNTIRDLMGVDFKVEEEFPPDDTGYGFDNIGDVLSVSPMLLEKYMAAAEAIVGQAVPSVAKITPEKVINGAAFVGGGRGANNISLYRQGTFSQTVNIEQAGDYKVVVAVTVNGSFDFDPARAKVAFKEGEETLYTDEYVWQDNKKYNYEIARKWEPGEKTLTFDMQPQVERGATQTAQGARNLNVDMRIVNVRVVGPLDADHAINPPNYTRFFTKSEPPKADPERRAYAKEVLGSFATKAFRRPVDERTVDRLAAVAENIYTQPGKTFEKGIQQAMIATLASPRFIFRVEDTEAADRNKPSGMVDEYALASRLSYFLWSTMPDEELFSLAQHGELRKNLPAQVKRMLTDSRSESLSQNFTGQWLEARDIDNITVTAKVVLARDNGTEAQLRAEEEAARAARGRGRGRGNFAQAQQQAAAQQQQQQAAADPAVAAAEAKPADAVAAAADNKQADPAAQAAQVQEAKPADAAQAAQAQDAKPAEQVAQALAQPDQAAAGAPAAGPRGQQPPAGAAAFAGLRRGAGARRGGAAAQPTFDLDRDLRTAMRRETEMSFRYIVDEDRSLLELVDANYTFLNERLARQYGITGVVGAEMRKVELPEGSPRGGVLTQGTMLVVTSNPTRTSPVKRGLFILDNILGNPPPPPPADIPPLEQAEKGVADHEPTMRESMQIHREKPLCASCHVRMDPLGLALENFNALGMFRAKERNQDIDARGKLVSGEEFSGVQELKQIIKEKRRDDFYRCVTDKLMTYAMGRGMTYSDVETIDQIVDQLKRDDGKFSTLLNGVINSAPFQKRRNIPSSVATVSPAQAAPIEDEVKR